VYIDDLTDVSYDSKTAPGEPHGGVTLYYEIAGRGAFTLSNLTGGTWNHYDLTATIKSAWAGEKLTRIGFYETLLGDYGVLVDNVSVTAVPEPANVAGIGLLALVLRRRKRA